MKSTIVERAPNGQNVGHDLSGKQYGQLTILEKTDKRTNGYIVWRARCSCGKIIERPSYRFIRGQKSCGCGPVGRPRIPNNGAHVNALFGHYRTSARHRKLEFSLTKAQARKLFEKNCAYCGAPPTVTYTHNNLSGEYAWNGIDRTNPEIGYTPDNCVTCCSQCNFAKGTMSATEFKAWIQRVHSHLFDC